MRDTDDLGEGRKRNCGKAWAKENAVSLKKFSVHGQGWVGGCGSQWSSILLLEGIVRQVCTWNGQPNNDLLSQHTTEVNSTEKGHKSRVSNRFRNK